MFTKEELNMLADGIVLIKKMCRIDDDTLEKLDKLDDKLCLIINNHNLHTKHAEK